MTNESDSNIYYIFCLMKVWICSNILLTGLCVYISIVKFNALKFLIILVDMNTLQSLPADKLK